MDIIFSGIPEKAHVDLKRWAQITIEKWQYNLVKKKLIYSGDLLRSFEASVFSDAKGDYALISFAFKYYMRMLDMGVGSGVTFDDAKMGRTGRRNTKKVFLRTFYSELYRLSELISEKYATNSAFAIINEISDSRND